MSESGNLAYELYKAVWTALDWLFPPRCGGCGAAGKRWCADCQSSVRVIKPPICDHCGQPQSRNELCARCQGSPYSFVALRSWAVFGGPLREALHRLKYRRDVALSEALAIPLMQTLKSLAWPVDLVTPVPLGLARLAERGYNQSALLARPVALGCKLEYQPQALQRVRETRSQVGLTAKLRRENVAGAFQASSEIVVNKTVLVIDDVATSGSTLDACASALLGAGAHQVFGLTLARAVQPEKTNHAEIEPLVDV